MSMKAIKKIVATVGEKPDGKKIYQRMGTLFERDDGSQCVKIDCLPVSKTWDGWANFYDMDPKKNQAPSNNPEAPF